MRSPTLLLTALVLAACSERTAPVATLPAHAIPFQCGDTRIGARFGATAMLLTLEGRTYRLMQEPSASGARYGTGSGADRIEFWNKGNEAMLSRGARTWPICQQAKGS
jgi:membrane-bound inhibitor of C-type lysozyme